MVISRKPQPGWLTTSAKRALPTSLFSPSSQDASVMDCTAESTIVP